MKILRREILRRKLLRGTILRYGVEAERGSPRQQVSARRQGGLALPQPRPAFWLGDLKPCSYGVDCHGESTKILARRSELQV